MEVITTALWMAVAFPAALAAAAATLSGTGTVSFRGGLGSPRAWVANATFAVAEAKPQRN